MKFLLIWITLTGAQTTLHKPIEYDSMEHCRDALLNLTPPMERTEEYASHLPGWYCVPETDL